MKLFTIEILLLILTVSSSSFSQNFEIATWQGFRAGAVCYTFDDNSSGHFSKVIPLFNEFGYNATFNVVVNWAGSYWSQLASAAAQGHEIASHTMSHPSFGTIDDAQEGTEQRNAQVQINSHVPGRQCLTIAYPNCVVGNVDTTKKYYIAARGCSGAVEPSTPANMFNISSIVVGTEGTIKTVANFNSKAEEAARKKGLMVYLIHGVDGDGGWSNISSDTLRKHLEFIKEHDDRYWVATFLNAARYILERNNSVVYETASTDTSINFYVEDALVDSVYNIGVTLRHELPAGWESAVIMQGGKAVSSKIVEADLKKYIQFDAIPDSRPYSMVKSTVVTVREENPSALFSFDLTQNYPNPFNPETRISYSVPQKGLVQLKVYDIFGKEVASLVNEQQSAGIYEVEFSGRSLASGIYFYRLQSGNMVSTRKFILMK